MEEDDQEIWIDRWRRKRSQVRLIKSVKVLDESSANISPKAATNRQNWKRENIYWVMDCHWNYGVYFLNNKIY